MNRSIFFLSRGIYILLLFLFSLAGLAQSYYKVTAQKVNVRSLPSTKSTVVGSLTGGTIVKVNAMNKGWASISYKGKTCYVSAQFLQEYSIQQREEPKPIPKTSKKAVSDLPTNNSHRPMSRSYTSQSSTSSAPNTFSRRKALWRFDVSAMPHSGEGEWESVLDLSVMLGGDIPLTILDKPFILETGLRYMHKKGSVVLDNNILMSANFVEIPARLAYDLPLARDFSFRLGAGPFFSYLTDEGGGLNIGIEPAASLKYKNFSVGVLYSAALYKGYGNGGKENVPMLNLSIRFGGKAWKNIGNALLVAGDVSQAILDNGLLGNTNQMSSDYNSEYSADDYNINKTSNKKKRNNEDSQKRLAETKKKMIQQSGYDVTHYKSAARNYSDYVNLIIKITTRSLMRGCSFEEKKREVKKYQDKLKQIRTEFEKGSGHKLPDATDRHWEDWNPSHDDLMEKCNSCGADGKCHDFAHNGAGKCKVCNGSNICQKCKGKKYF